MDLVWLAHPSELSVLLHTIEKLSNWHVVEKVYTSEEQYKKMVAIACLSNVKWNVKWVPVFLPLFRGDVSLSLLLMEGVIAEWFQMIVAVYLLCNLAPHTPYLLPPLRAMLMLCIWKQHTRTAWEHYLHAYISLEVITRKLCHNAIVWSGKGDNLNDRPTER